MKRAVDWPRYLKIRQLADGSHAYYWVPPERDRKAGFSIPAEALGKDFPAAAERARMLNAHLDAWREGREQPREPGDDRRVGTVDWWHQQYFSSDEFKILSPRSQADYRQTLASIADLPTKRTDPATGEPERTGTLPVSSLSQAAADLIYARLRRGGAVTRQADYAIDVARRAWNVARRKHAAIFLVPIIGTDGREHLFPLNPFHGVERKDYERETATPAMREQALAFAKAAAEAKHTALGIAGLICFEWHQRPEDVRRGRITWADYRPPERPNKVRVFHHKTGKRVWKLLDVAERRGGKIVTRPLYPELEQALAALPRLGVSIVMHTPQRGPKDQSGKRIAKLYSDSYAQHLVQMIRKDAGLPEYFTLEACRHGGLTELGDAELTEQEIMTLSTHATPDAARVYVKRSERQELRAAVKRRDYIEGKRTKQG